MRLAEKETAPAWNVTPRMKTVELRQRVQLDPKVKRNHEAKWAPLLGLTGEVTLVLHPWAACRVKFEKGDAMLCYEQLMPAKQKRSADLRMRGSVMLCDGMAGLRATLAAEAKVLDKEAGLVEYVASDETIDAYRELVRADGWRFDLFEKNSPFVNTHDYSDIRKQLGVVVDWRVDKKARRLIETVKWAKDVEENVDARLGWKMTLGGFLKAVSVGFRPLKYASRWDSNPALWQEQLAELEVHEETGLRCVYIEHQQIELSACIIGANPNALQMAAKAYKAGALNDSDIEAYVETLSQELANRETANPADEPAAAGAATQQAREKFLGRFERALSLT